MPEETITMTLSVEEREELEALRLEKKLNATKVAIEGITFKVSPKGAVSVYGIGRFPVTLYKGQWEKIIARTADLTQYIADNKAMLSEKAPKASK